MHLLIRTVYRQDIRADIVKVENETLYYKVNNDSPWFDIPVVSVKAISVRDHWDKHPAL